MPAKTDMPDVLLELSQLARDTGIRFDSISPQPAVSMGSYTVLPISVTFNGTFYDLADLLYRLRSLVTVHAGRLDATGRLFSVDTLAFGESPLKFPRIQATLLIDAYVYGAAPAGSSSSPATPTTSTSTTETTTTGTTTTGTTTTTPASGTSASAAGAP
jgi:type IV pilus assembly protein PilO